MRSATRRPYELGGKGGVTLESLGAEPLRTAYIAVGTPKKDVNGQITNAVVISPYYSGDSTFDYFFWYKGQKGNAFAVARWWGPGELIDTNKWYVIFVDSLGLWGTSKPSDGLGMKFPQYTIFDMVQANYRLLKGPSGGRQSEAGYGAFPWVLFKATPGRCCIRSMWKPLCPLVA